MLFEKIKIKRSLIFSFLIVGLFIGCTKKKHSENDVVISSLKPIDEATHEERVQIEETLAEISKMASDHGVIEDFKSIPILVTSESVEETKRLGYCQYAYVDETGKATDSYIAINRRQFEEDKKNSKYRPLFRTILHEIGHCYYFRNHEVSTITKSGCSFKLLNGNDENYYTVTSFIPATVMYVDIVDGEQYSSPLTEYKPFQAFYVGEIMKSKPPDVESFIKSNPVDLLCSPVITNEFTSSSKNHGSL